MEMAARGNALWILGDAVPYDDLSLSRALLSMLQRPSHLSAVSAVFHALSSGISSAASLFGGEHTP